MSFILQSKPNRIYCSGAQDVNHIDEDYNGRVPDIIDNAFVVVDFQNGVRANLDLCMFAENSNFQEEICGVGDKGKIETFVPSDASGKNSSELSIGLRGKKEIYSENNCQSLEVENTTEDLFPFLVTVPLQKLAYYSALKKGYDIDKPRNLAKSVTVE